MPNEPIPVACPNCQKPAIRSGNEITCENCDAVFVITKKQAAKLKQVGAIEDLQDRVEKLESLIPDGEQQPEETPAGPEVKTEETEETEEQPIL